MQHHHPLHLHPTPDTLDTDPPRRRMLMALAALGAGPALWPSSACAQVAPVYGNFRGASLGANANLNGAVAFPASHAFNTDITKAPVDPNSAAILNSIGLTANLRPDFGSGTWDGGPIGIPYVVVSGTQAKVAIRFTAYGSESDPGPYPVPRTAPIEGGPNSAGDRHVIVIDRDNQRLYELHRAFPQADGSWTGDCGAVFALDSTTIRPGGKAGWTSADAAGLPILPGLIRYEEASKGAGGIRHALRFTVSKTRRAYVPPATHWASSNVSTHLAADGRAVPAEGEFRDPGHLQQRSQGHPDRPEDPRHVRRRPREQLLPQRRHPTRGGTTAA